MLKQRNELEAIKREVFEWRCRPLTLDEILEGVSDKYKESLNPVRYISWPWCYIDDKVEKKAKKKLGKNFSVRFYEYQGKQWTAITW